MLTWLVNKVKLRQARLFSERARAWHENCLTIARTCGDVLYNPDTTKTDIRMMFTAIDHLLFSEFHLQSLTVHRTLRPQNPGLARRVSRASEGIIRLRNQTLRFLIRSQSTNGGSGNSPADWTGQQAINYYFALEDSGFAARQLIEEVNKELQSIWHEMQGLVIQAEQLLAA